MFKIESSESWKNPPAAVRIALVATVFAALGVIGGLYFNLLPWLRDDPLAAEIVGALIGAAFGAWFECDGQATPNLVVNSAVRDEETCPPLASESGE